MKLIVEMEMPKRCIECGVRLKCKRYVCGLYQEIADELNPLMGDKDCLIKGVLPDEHGDLIDRDALLETCIYYNIDPNKSAVDADNIQDMPVIIAAERKDNGN